MVDQFEEKRVIFPDQESFQAKLDKIVEDGIDKLHVISDFDMTLSRAAPLNTKEDVFSTHSVFERSAKTSQAYRDKVKGLFQKYYPIETSPDMTKEEKLPHMVEWYETSHNALLEEGFARDELAPAVLNTKIQLRDGVKSFLETLQAEKVPVLIFSAGIANIIEVILKDKEEIDVDESLIHIISNWMKFDDSGKISSFSEPLIHMFNKNESQTKGHSYWKQVEAHKNVLLLGDGMGDIHMADGLEHETMIKVGFLNHNVDALLPTYEKLYDVILTGNPDFSFINEMIISKLLDKKSSMSHKN